MFKREGIPNGAFMHNQLMRLKNLAEAIIAQSIEDLWSPVHKGESIVFFVGDGFRLASGIAGMKAADKFKLLLIMRRCGQEARKADNTRRRLVSGDVHELSIL